MAGKMSIGRSPDGPLSESLAPFERPGLSVVRGGFVRACRAGWDRRCEEASAGGGLADFMTGVVVIEDSLCIAKC